MNYHRFLFILGIVLILAVGCSEERKREAARLAAQLEGDTTAETLAGAAVTEDVQDSVGYDTVASSLQAPNETLVVADTLSGDTAMGVSIPKVHAADSVADTGSLARPSRPVREMPPIVSEGYTVQVESSPLKGYIEGQVEVFKQRGYNAYISGITRPSDQKAFYRLRIGRLATKAEADALSQELNTTFNLQSWVDKTTFGPSTPSGEHPR